MHQKAVFKWVPWLYYSSSNPIKDSRCFLQQDVTDFSVISHSNLSSELVSTLHHRFVYHHRDMLSTCFHNTMLQR